MKSGGSDLSGGAFPLDTPLRVPAPHPRHYPQLLGSDRKCFWGSWTVALPSALSLHSYAEICPLPS